MFGQLFSICDYFVVEKVFCVKLYYDVEEKYEVIVIIDCYEWYYKFLFLYEKSYVENNYLVVV